jgi:hypothetical protein
MNRAAKIVALGAIVAAAVSTAWTQRESFVGSGDIPAPQARPAARHVAAAPAMEFSPRAPSSPTDSRALPHEGSYPTKPIPEKIGAVEGAADDDTTEAARLPAAAALPPPAPEDRPVPVQAAPVVDPSQPAPRKYMGEGAADDEASERTD